METISGLWNWYIAGPLIGLFVPILLIVGNKMFGISSSFVHVCAMALPKAKRDFLSYDFKINAWKFYFVLGILLGGFVSDNFLSSENIAYLPEQYYSLSGFVQLFIGGVFVGFGTRYANGCTSGHAITGLSLLQTSSLKSTLAFFASGMIYTTIVVYFL